VKNDPPGGDQQNRDEHRSNDRADPWHRKKKEDVPLGQRNRPTEYNPQPNVVENIPDAERNGEEGKTAPTRRACYESNGSEHDHGCELADKFDGELIGSYGFEWKGEPFRIVQGTKIDHDGRFDKRESCGETKDPTQSVRKVHCGAVEKIRRRVVVKRRLNE
jgi:hypothetical protein